MTYWRGNWYTIRFRAARPPESRHPGAMNSPVRILISLLAATIVVCTGCGQKGPLYWPDDPSRIHSEMPPEAPIPGEAASSDDEADGKEGPDGSVPD
jgi:predicted small lipoprotein YifL